MNSTQTLSVTGMTCQNCVRHVTEALRALPGVRDVTVDLESAQARIAAERDIPRADLEHALEEAGYGIGS